MAALLKLTSPKAALLVSAAAATAEEALEAMLLDALVALEAGADVAETDVVLVVLVVLMISPGRLITAQRSRRFVGNLRDSTGRCGTFAMVVVDVQLAARRFSGRRRDRPRDCTTGGRMVIVIIVIMVARTLVAMPRRGTLAMVVVAVQGTAGRLRWRRSYRCSRCGTCSRRRAFTMVVVYVKLASGRLGRWRRN